jgi:preprotein translocase subunit SecG
MESLLITIHYFICAFLIIVILLQAGKGADIGAVFGGGSQTVFGSRGPATFLSKLTAVVAVAFLVTSIWLAHISKNRSVTSVIDRTPVSGEESAPAAPAEPAAPTEEEAPAGQPPAK